MSGRYNGLQANVAAKNNLAAWIPCAGHSLNLVVKAAAEYCTAAVSFFDILECVFFTASTHHYEVRGNTLKSADDLSACPKGSTIHGGRVGQMLETGIYSVFWNEILERVNATSRMLQDPTLDLNAAVAMVVSLKRFVEAKRETFTEYERHGATLSGTSDYVQTRQRPRNVRMLNSLLLRSFVSLVTFR